jgi:hypothetical protein
VQIRVKNQPIRLSQAYETIFDEQDSGKESLMMVTQWIYLDITLQ